MKITEAIKDRILVLDGAMGTMIQSHGLSESDYRGNRFSTVKTDQKGNNDLLSLTQPDIIQEIHLAYLKAGADIIETNTFNANSISMDHYNMKDLVYEMNVASAAIAKEAVNQYSKQHNKQTYVAGALGPTNRMASMSPDVERPGFRNIDFDELANAYYTQAKGLMDGGADLLLVETVFDTLNAKAALYAIAELFEDSGASLPVMVSGTVTDESGRLLSGQTVEAFLISLSHFPLFAIGLNCALGARQLRQYAQVLAKEAPYYISVYPNAGLPNELGNYDQTADIMGKELEEYLELNLVNIIGGCCGTTPNHIKEIANLSANYSPRQLPQKSFSI